MKINRESHAGVFEKYVRMGAVFQKSFFRVSTASFFDYNMPGTFFNRFFFALDCLIKASSTGNELSLICLATAFFDISLLDKAYGEKWKLVMMQWGK